MERSDVILHAAIVLPAEALMNAAAAAAWGARAVLVNDLPEWAKVLAAECPGYQACGRFR